jgi:hypothetical protein
MGKFQSELWLFATNFAFSDTSDKRHISDQVLYCMKYVCILEIKKKITVKFRQAVTHWI